MKKKYGIETQIEFELITFLASDLKSGLSFVAGEVQISKDGGSFADATNLATIAEIGSTGIYKLTLTSTEMTAARICVKIVDGSSPKLWHDSVLWIETYGTSSSADLDVDDFKADVSNLDAAISTRAPANEYDTEMARIDTTVSSRLAASAYASPDNASIADIEGKVDNIKAKTDNLPANTSTELDAIDSAIAGLNDISTTDVGTVIDGKISAIQSGLAPAGEYDTEMAHLDVDVSSRLAAVDYTAPTEVDLTDIENKIDNIDTVVDAIAEDVSAEVAGTVLYSYGPVRDNSGNLLNDVFVTVRVNGGGENITIGLTGLDGMVDFWLVPGTYDFYSRKNGYSFPNPDTEVVS